MFRHGTSKMSRRNGLSEQRNKRTPSSNLLPDQLVRSQQRRNDSTYSTMQSQQKSNILPSLPEGSLPLLQCGSKMTDAQHNTIPEKKPILRPDLRAVMSSKLSTANAEQNHLKKLITQKIEEVKQNTSVQKIKDTQKKTSLGQCDLSKLQQMNSSRDLSQYGAFKKSTTSVSTNSQSNRFSVRREPLALKKVSIEQIPVAIPSIMKSIGKEEYQQKMKKFEQFLAESSHNSEYIQEDIRISRKLEESNDMLNEKIPDCLPGEQGSELAKSGFLQESSLAVSLYQ